MTNQLGDAPTDRAQRDRDVQRTMLEVRALYPFDPHKTQPVKVEQRVVINTGWRLRLALTARRVFGKGKKS